ncbi:MAG: YibE/F family protein, partial [Candidatus Paceibacterota bacterium]
KTPPAQTAYEEVQAIVKAEIIEIVSEREEIITGTDAIANVQTVRARLKEGENAGDTVLFESDLLQLKEGDSVYLTHVRDINGQEIYILKDVDRGGGLAFLFIIFVVLLLLFAGWQGARALGSLMLSILGIVFVLLPALLAGYDPILMSLLISGVILALALFGTHGFTAIASIAYFGTVSAVLITSGLAWWFVSALRLSGYGSDASVYLNFATRGELDLSGLLLGSIIIGVLGVLDDISITQASVVRQLRIANASLAAVELYRRAIKVGRDHVGSLVNTLALAYVGAALPLVLLFSTSEAPLYFTLNQEVIAAELARILIGSIGLILAVPLTTIIAAWWFGSREVTEEEHDSHGHYHQHQH